MKVLIVDDEYLVRLGLRTTFNWALHGFEIVGEASGGKEALRIFEETDPDILLTDIKMPGMDGLQLIEALKARKPSLYVVILSNHSDFAYAQEAIRLGASQYILKNELNEETILSVLSNLTDGVEADPEAKRHHMELERLVRKALQPGMSVQPLSEKAVEQFAPGRYLAIACSCDTASINAETQAIFHKAFQNMLDQIAGKEIQASQEINNMLHVMLLSRVEDAAQEEAVYERMRQIITSLNQYYEVELRIGFSDVLARERINDVIRHANEALDICFFIRENAYFWKPSIADAKAAVVPYQLMKSLLKNGTWHQLKAELQKIFDDLRARRKKNVTDSCFIDLLSIARQTAFSSKLLGEPFINEKKLDDYSHHTFDHIDAMEVYVLDLYRSMSSVLNGKGKTYSSIVSKCITFIHAHYATSISLAEAAAEVNVSKSYLSLLFKQETGVNFSKYLMDYRIAKAKELLSGSNQHIYEIAEQVGFLNPYYFSKIFKEYTGSSCQEYRNLHCGA